MRVAIFSSVLASSYVLNPPTAAAGPITFNTALPVGEGEAIYRLQTVWTRSTNDPSPMQRELNVIAVPSVLAVGAHSRVTLFGVLPYLYKDLRLSTPDGRVTRSTGGFGDMTALVRLTALKFDARGRTARVAPVHRSEVAYRGR